MSARSLGAAPQQPFQKDLQLHFCPWAHNDPCPSFEHPYGWQPSNLRVELTGPDHMGRSSQGPEQYVEGSWDPLEPAWPATTVSMVSAFLPLQLDLGNYLFSEASSGPFSIGRLPQLGLLPAQGTKGNS